MMTLFSASACSTALIDFSRETESGTMMNGKITRSFNGSTGSTSGILIASSLAVSLGSVIRSSCCRETAESPCNACSRISRLFGVSLLRELSPIQAFAQEQNRADDHHRHRTDDVKQNCNRDRGVDVELIERRQHILTDLMEPTHAARRGNGDADRRRSR